MVVRVAVVEQSGENGLYSSASPVHTSQFQTPSASSVTPQRLYLSSPGQTSFDYFLDMMLFHGDLMKPVLFEAECPLLQVRLPTHPRIPPLHRQKLSSLLLIKSYLLLDNSMRGFKVRLVLLSLLFFIAITHKPISVYVWVCWCR